MKKIALIMLLVGSCIACVKGAKEPEKPKTEPAQMKTVLENFSSKIGVVIVKSYSSIGSIQSLGRVDVDADEFRIANDPNNRAYGIIITVNEMGSLERSNRAYIDYDEIDSLLQGIDYISKVTKDVTTLDNFEAHYVTKGDFRIGTFSSRDGINVVVSSGNIGGAYFGKQGDLDKIKKLVSKAKEVIDKAKQSPK